MRSVNIPDTVYLLENFGCLAYIRHIAELNWSLFDSSILLSAFGLLELTIDFILLSF